MQIAPKNQRKEIRNVLKLSYPLHNHKTSEFFKNTYNSQTKIYDLRKKREGDKYARSVGITEVISLALKRSNF